MRLFGLFYCFMEQFNLRPYLREESIDFLILTETFGYSCWFALWKPSQRCTPWHETGCRDSICVMKLNEEIYAMPWMGHKDSLLRRRRDDLLAIIDYADHSSLWSLARNQRQKSWKRLCAIDWWHAMNDGAKARSAQWIIAQRFTPRHE